MSRVALLTALSLVAFAGNSLLCRLALAEQRIDAASFTAVRLVSGAVVLGALAGLRTTRWPGTWGSSLALFLYAAPFSFAYLWLDAGVGALVLFGCVQLTMFGWGALQGERFPGSVLVGLLVAMAGLVVLTASGRASAHPWGVAGMATAGVAWGVYSLRGRTSSAAPLQTTAANFIGAVPPALVLVAWTQGFGGLRISLSGALLAAASGAIASGLGYSLWYAALKQLSSGRAAVLQLLVPVLAALGGVAWLGEPMTLRLVVAGAAILGGVGLAIRARESSPTEAEPARPSAVRGGVPLETDGFDGTRAGGRKGSRP